MNRIRVSTQVFLCFLLMVFLMAMVGCSSKDNAPLPTTYTISGTVTGAANVTVTLSGAATGTATVATSGGTYSFTGLSNGTYAVTPSATGYSFDPITAAIIVNGSNMVQNFVTAAIGGTPVTISGTVQVGLTPLPGVKVTLSGTRNASVITGADGTWSFAGLSNTGSDHYYISAYLSGYSITPVQYEWNGPGSDSLGNVFSATPANFSQADLTGTWDVRMLKAASGGGWKRATITLDNDGELTGATDCLDNTGDTSCPGVGNITWTINASTGVITETGIDAGTNVHMTMASNKTFIAGTEDNSKLLIAQKKVTGTSYAAADVQSKNFVFHQLNVGSSNKWQYGVGSTSSTGAINISSATDPSGTTIPGDVGSTISVDSNGIVSMSDNATWKGFFSADHRTIVGIDTESGGTEFHMLIIQLTDGQSSSLGQVVGISVEHMLATGASPAPLWEHQTITINSSGVMSFSNYLDSNGGTTASTDTPTISIGLSGTATVTLGSVTPDFHGQLSYDGWFMVGTQTFDTGIYSLQIITH